MYSIVVRDGREVVAKSVKEGLAEAVSFGRRKMIGLLGRMLTIQA